MGSSYVIAAATLFVCLGIAGICLCRLRLTSVCIKRGVRVKYTGLGGAALVYGLGPWVGEWPGWTGFAFAVAVLVGLLSSSRRWRVQAPQETRSDYHPPQSNPPTGSS